ncbi:MAG: hypothetical protein RQ801_02030, partial [Spirochaetaceae bacterium]|nr:hypothetical protein [Spirochaetaceae bacterium]
AVEMEQRGELPQRVLGLFYPPEIPPGDFMNEDGSGWIDPRFGGEKRRESFVELYESVLGDAVIAMKSVMEGDPFDCLGDGDLDDGSPKDKGGKFLYSNPFNLSPIIDGMYKAVSQRHQ